MSDFRERCRVLLPGWIRKGRGLTLIEVLLALTIGGMVVASVVAFYLSGSASVKANTHIQRIQKAAADVSQLYSARGNYDGLDNSVAISAGIVPNAMIASRSNSTIQNAWGGAVTFSAATDGSGSVNNNFSISSAGLPEQACIDVASANMGSASLTKLKVNKTTVISTKNTNTSADEIPISEVTGACKADSSNEITWQFR